MGKNKNKINAKTPKSVKRSAGKSGGFSKKAYSLSTGTPELRDPIFNPESFYLAKDLQASNRWIRYYDTYHPILPNSLDIHATFPISDFSFKGVEDPFILDFYNYVKEDVLHLLDWVILASREYEVLGEAFSFFGWDSYNGYFNSATILNPDLLEIYPFDWEGGRKYVISMDIPETFEMLRDKKDLDMRYRGLWDNLDPVIRRCVDNGTPIPLSPNNVFGMQRLAFPYDIRGTSQVLRCLKDLMYEDKLREAQMAVADGHITPYQIWKIGNTAQGYIPTDAELDDWNSLLEMAEHQNLFRIVTHDSVSYETKGVQEGLLPITPELDKIEDRLLTALYTSRAWTTGEGPCVSSDTEVLTRRGFIKFPLVTMEDEIASVNPDTHEIEYCKPNQILKFNVEGDMYHFKKSNLDHYVTPNHRCFVKHVNADKFDITLAENIKSGYHFKCSVAPFKGDNPETITIGSKKYLYPEYLTFAALYLSEGSVEYNKSGSAYGLRISQTKIHKKGLNPFFDSVEKAVKAFYPEAVYNQYGDDVRGYKGRFEINNQDLANHFKDTYGVGSSSKFIPDFIKNLSGDLLEYMLKGFFYGDGGLLNKDCNTGSFEVTTVSKKLADDMQEIAFKCGKATKITCRKRKEPRKDLYRVCIYNKNIRRFGLEPLVVKKDIKVNYYEGDVYSFDLPPNRLYVSRRNGLITITGNTYSNAVIGLKVLEGRYQNKLYRIASIIKQLYRKIAIANDFYKTTEAQVAHKIRPSRNDREYMVPQIHWDNYFSFAKDIERAKFYYDLAKAHKISYKRVFEILGLDYDEEKRLLSEDMSSVFQDEIWQSKINNLVNMVDGNSPVGKGTPTNFAEPGGTGSAGDSMMEEEGMDQISDAGSPPLPDVEQQMGEI